MKRIVLAATLSALVYTFAYPYGWWVHYTEGLLYIERLHNEPLPGPKGDAELLENNLSYFALGTWLPDIERVLFDMPQDFSHSQDFQWFMYQKAIEDMDANPWKVALAVGNILHSSSDMVAQVLSCSYFACKAGFGLLDIFPGFYDDNAGGENEGFFEAGMDVLFGDYTPIFQHVIQVLSDPETFSKFRTFVQDCIDEYAGKKVSLKADFYETFQKIAELAQKSDLQSRLLMYELFASEGSSDKLEIPTEIDFYELFRVLLSPAILDKSFYDEYFGYFKWLSTQIAREMEPGSNWFDVWPTWHATTFLSGGVQGLSPHTDELNHNCAQLLWSIRFTDINNNTVSSLSTQNWKEQLKIKLSMINVLSETKTITVKVKYYDGGLNWQNDPVIAEGSFTIDDIPHEYGQNPITNFELLFDMPEPTNVYAIYFELYLDDASKPYLVSLPLPYYLMNTVDPFKSQYTEHIFCETCFPPHPVVIDPISELDFGWLHGKVIDRLSKKPVKYAQVSYGGDETLTTTRFGYFQIDNLQPQSLELSAYSEDYFEGSTTANVEAGKGIWATIECDPKIKVYDGGDYTSNNAYIYVSYEKLKKFKGLLGYSVGIGSSPDEADIVPFTFVGSESYAFVPFGKPLADGLKIYALVRPEVADIVAAHSSSDGITIDASPPKVKEIKIIDTSKDNGFRVEFSVEIDEPHTPIVLVEACLGSREGLCDLVSPNQIKPERASLSMLRDFKRSIFLNVWAQNAAGLKSEVASQEVKSEDRELFGSEEGCGCL